MEKLDFETLETEVVKELSQRSDTVVALGGGALQRPENRQQLFGTGAMIWLQAAAETIQSVVSREILLLENDGLI